MVNLSELLALRPELHACKKVLYFHENQLAYPTRVASSAVVPGAASAAVSAALPRVTDSPQDFQFGWIQFMSALAADECVFNSHYNLESFLGSLPRHMAQIPEPDLRLQSTGARTGDALPVVLERLRLKCRVLPFPVQPPVAVRAAEPTNATQPAHIVWNHRWEFDKDPDTFFDALDFLLKKRVPFEVSVLGETFGEQPPVFAAHEPVLRAAGVVRHWGYAPSREEYWNVLQAADIVVSTAIHEFFGVSIVEAILAGCYPLCPARLAYPEIVAPHPHEQAADTLITSTSASSTWWDAASRARPEPVDEADRARKEKLHRLFTPFGDRVDARPSPHLYKSPRELKQSLYSLCRDVSSVRAWRARQLANAPGLPASADTSDSIDVTRFTPATLDAAYSQLLAPRGLG